MNRFLHKLTNPVDRLSGKPLFYGWHQTWPSISRNYKAILLQNTNEFVSSSKVMYIPYLTLKHDTPKFGALCLPKFDPFSLNLFCNPNLCFPRTDNRASLCQHTILLLKCSSLAFLWAKEFGCWCNRHVDVPHLSNFHVTLLSSLWIHRAAQVQAETSSLTHKKPTRLESANCRFKPGYKTEGASLYKLLLSAWRDRNAGHRNSYQVTTYMK